jgi:predicted nucleotide-binding protein
MFVGSSVEGRSVAYAIQENLEYDAEVTVWPQGFFAPSQTTLNALLSQVGNFDFALMVFSPDDILRLREGEFRTARDNVIFELGLFYGRLGQDRCFFVVPRNVADFHLPTDLLGITPLN